MSREIDERVVKIEFDNSRFEQNTQQSISTIEKLKKSLKFDGAKQGFEDIDKAQSKIGFTAMISGLDGLTKKFRAMEVIGITALANITNSVVDAGKKMVKSLSIDQVTAGWEKYEEKTTAVQTIMSATRKDFENEEQAMKVVNAQLERLNWFTDETSYSLTDMTNNIGKFVSNKVPLEEAATAMQGISVWAAASGQNAATASRAMYNLSQALGMGSVKVQDWMSIENANMATAEFKQLVIDTAKELGVLNSTGGFKKTQVTAENFRSTLSEGWFTKEVLTEALNKYGHFADVLYDATEKTGLSATELLKEIDKYKESASGLAEAGTVIEGTLGDIAKRVMKGEFGNGNARRSALEAMGLDPDKVQAEVNRIAQGFKASEESLSVLPESLADVDTGNMEYLKDLSEKTGMEVDDLKGLLDELSSSENELGYNSFKAAQEAKTFSDALGAIKDGVSTAWMNIFETIFGDYLTSKRLWTDLANWGYNVFAEPVNRLGEAVKKMKKAGIFSDLKSGFTAIKKYVDDLKEPFKTVFEKLFGGSFINKIPKIKKITVAFKNWAESLTLSEEQTEKLTAIAEKLGKALKWIIGKIKTILKFAGKIVRGSFDKVITWIKKIVLGISKFKVAIKNTNAFKKFKETMSKLFSGTKEERWKKLSDSFTHLKEIISNFFDELTISNIKRKFAELRTALTEWFNPIKTKFISIKEGLKSFFDSVVEALKNFGIDLTAVWDFVKKVAEKVKTFLQNGGLGGILSVIFGSLISVGFVKLVKRILRFFVGIQEILATINGVLSSIKGMFTSISKYFKEKVKHQLSNDILKIAVSVALLVGAILALTLLVPEEKSEQLKNAALIVGGILLALTAITALFALIGKKEDNTKGVKNLATNILMIAIALGIVAGAFYVMTNLVTKENLGYSMAALLGSILSIVLISTILNKYSGKFKSGSFSILLVAVALGIMANAFKKLSDIEPDKIKSIGVALLDCLLGLAGVVTALGLSKASGGAIAAVALISLSIFFFVNSIKRIIDIVKNVLVQGQVESAVKIMLGIMVVLLAFLTALKLLNPGKDAWSVGVAILAMTVSMLLMTKLINTILKMKGNIDGALIVVAGLALIVGLMAGALKLMGDSVKGGGGKTIIAFALAVGLLGLVAAALGQMKIGKLAKGVAAVSALAIGLGTALRIASKEADKLKVGPIVAMGVIILALSIMVGIFSTIPWQNLIPSVVSMAALMLTLGYTMKLAGEAGDKIKMKSILGMVIALAAVSAALLILTKNIEDPKDALTIAIGLSILMLALSGVMAICSKIGKAKLSDIAKGMLGLIMAITSLIAVAGALWVIEKMGIDSTLIPVAFGLIGLLAVLGLVSAEIGLLGITGMLGLTAAASGLGMLAITLVGMIAVAGALWIIKKMDIGECISIAKDLIKITAILGVLAVGLGGLGLLGMSGGFLAEAAGIGVIAIALAALAVVALAMWGLGLLIESTGVNDKMDSVISFSQKLGETLGAFVSGIVDKGTEGLEAAGEHIGNMWEKMKPFIDGIQSSGNLGGSIKNFSDGILSLTESGILNKIADFFGDSAIESIGEDLGNLIAQLGPLSELGKNNNLVRGANAIGSLGTAFDSFGKYNKAQIDKWIKGLPEFASMIAGLPYVSTSNIDRLVEATQKLKILVDGFNEVTDTTGVNEGIDTTSLEGLSNYTDMLKEYGDKVPILSDYLSNQNGLDMKGGLFGLINGSNADSFTSVGSSFLTFATGIEKIMGLDLSRVDSVGASLVALKASISDFIAENQYEAFSSAMESIGNSLSMIPDNNFGFAEKIQSVLTSGAANGVTNASEELESSMSVASDTMVQSLFQYMGEDIILGLPGFFEQIGDKMVEAVNGLSHLYGHVGSTAAKIFLGGMHKHITDAPEEVSAFSEQVVGSIAEAFEGNEIISGGLSTAGVTLGSALSEGFASLDYAAVGADGGQGIVNGLSSKIGDAYSAGYALGAAAVAGANAGLDNGSPSHLLFKSGVFGGMGLINGLKSMFSSVHRTGTKMGEEAVDSISAVISTVSKAMSSDDDMQPVIRPVVDLSNVEKSAGAVSGMFGHRVSIGSESYGKAQKISFLNGESKEIQNGSSGGPTYVNNNNIYPQQLNNSTVDYMFNLFDSRLGAKI